MQLKLGKGCFRQSEEFTFLSNVSPGGPWGVLTRGRAQAIRSKAETQVTDFPG